MTLAPLQAPRPSLSTELPHYNNRLWSAGRLPLVMAVLLAVLFVALPVRHDSDSYLAVPVSYALLTSGSPEVTRFVETYEAHHAIQWEGTRALPLYPLGASILALPIVAALSPFDPVLDKPSYLARADWARVSHIAASILGALTAWLLFLLLRRLSGQPLWRAS